MSPIPTTRPIPQTYETNAERRVRPEPHDRYRSREVGTGYGSSSGYAANRRYSASNDRSYFRWP